MASISKRGPVWRAAVNKLGQRHTGTFDTEAEARAWADRTEARIVNKTTAAQIRAVPTNLTAAGLFERYASEVSPNKRGARWEVFRLAALGRTPVFQMIATDINGSHLAAWRDERLKTVQAATVNRDLNLISAVFTRAIREWRVAGSNPVRDIMRPPQPRGRERRVTDDERDAIVQQLGWDAKSQPADLLEWTAWAFAFALETAMRQGEILAMRWGHIRGRYVHLPQTKNGDSRNAPLSSRALALLGLLAAGADGARVVPLEPGTCGAYFREACRGACIAGLHFHDARREAATRFAERVDPMELARILGHRDTRSTMIYYHPRAEDLADKLG